MRKVAVTGSFDNFGSRHARLLEEASKLGPTHVFLWSDETVLGLKGRAPSIPAQERLYMLKAMRYVAEVTILTGNGECDVPLKADANEFDTLVWDARSDSPQRRAEAEARALPYIVFTDEQLQGFQVPPFRPTEKTPGRKRVVVTGCFDWFHSGHVRFFEEASGLGDLYVVIGHDANIKLLKGEGHPLFTQDERRYMVHSVRHVKQTLISSGHGWMDAEPEFAIIQPDIYVVNEDGARPEKRSFCAAHQLEYVVRKRIPKEGLPRRQSTELRGF